MEQNNSKNNKKLIISVTLALIAGVGAGAYFMSRDKTDNDAQIIAVTPLFQTIDQPYNSCEKVATTYKTANQKNGETGTLVGGTVGGAAGGAGGAAIGSAAGGTGGAAIGGALGGAAGALGGGYVGGKVQKHNQPSYVTKHGYTTKCKILHKPVQTQVGYSTQYLYHNSVNTVVVQTNLPVGTKMPLNVLLALVGNQSQVGKISASVPQ